ncbi:MAG TPA: D-aminoacyl-tRNA deacylase [Bryobacteraceae bacterium]|nr:D-aminoacyl-tRNA deacylase [Bryobacteraceae bacterium]
MRFLIQRVSRASVRIEGRPETSIGSGLLVLIGISKSDTRRDADNLAEKLVHLRIFPDEAGRMNRSALETGAALMLVSQFTLYGDCSRGRRPGFDRAAPPELAEQLYDYAVEKLRASGLAVETGVFRAHMDVELVNDGPVTFLLET